MKKKAPDKPKRGRGRPTKYKKQYCKDLIEHMTEGKSFESFAATIGVSISTIYLWAGKESDKWEKEQVLHPEFSEAKKIGEAASLAFWEDLLRRGAMGEVDKFNATATIFSMKNRFVKYYRDRIEISGSGDGSLDSMSDEELEKIAAGGLKNKRKKKAK